MRIFITLDDVRATLLQMITFTIVSPPFQASFDDHIYAWPDSSHANERIQQNVCWFNSEIELTTFSTLESVTALVRFEIFTFERSTR